MVDGLDGLRHDAVVSRNDDDRKVSHLRTTGTHRRKGLMARSIKECDTLSVRKLHIICSDMLGDTTGLTGNHISLSDIVEERSLTVVYVSHDSDYRWTREEIFLCILSFSLSDGVSKVCRNELDFIAELLGNKNKGLCIETLVDGYHHSETHAGSDDLCHRSIVHKGREVVYSNELRHLEHLLFEFLQLHLFLHPL